MYFEMFQNYVWVKSYFSIRLLE